MKPGRIGNPSYSPRQTPRSATRGAEDGERSELLAEDGLARTTEPVVKERGIDAAEVDRVLRVAVSKVTQIRIRAVQPRLDARTKQEHRGGSAVISPTAGVLRKTTPELRKDQHQHAARVTRLAQVVDEGAQRVADFAEQVVVHAELVGMRVEAVKLRVIETRGQTRLDE